MKKEIYIGWDIGGAHIKSCVINDQRTVCSVNLCELWKTKEAGYMIDKIIKQYNDKAIVNNVITMSGEMCDIFENREEGVKKILNYFKKFVNTYVYTQNSGIISIKHNKKSQNIASANWHVIAKFMSKKLANAIIIDLGSVSPIISKTIKVFKRESEISEIIWNYADRYKEISIGSYPFNNSGTFGVEIVVRHTDQILLNKVFNEILTEFSEPKTN